MMKIGYSARVDEILSRIGSDITEQEFAELALACLDQAGLPERFQRKLEKMINEEMKP